MRLEEEEVKKIIRETPFIKRGQLLSQEALWEDSVLANTQLSDLKFEDKLIGKGSYGTV